MHREANNVIRKHEFPERSSGHPARAPSWLSLVVLLVIPVSLAACGSLESPSPAPVRTASPTPTTSPTPQPSATPTTSPSPSPTQSATPESLVLDHPDGSISFVDRKVGYTITFPPGWIILEVTGRKNDEVFSAAAEEFPDLQDGIAIFTLTSPDIRIFALSIDPDFLALETPPVVGVLITDSPSSPSLDFMLRASVQALSKFLEAKILSSEQITNSKGVPLGIMTYDFGPTNEVDFLASTFGKGAMFYVEGTLVTVTGSVNEALRAELEPIFDTIFDNIELVGA